jgi:hypothetical protein
VSEGAASAARRRPRSWGARRAAVEADALGGPEAQARLDQAELQALEAGGGHQKVAEVEEVHGRHGLEHVELLDQELLDLDDALDAVDGRAQAGVVGARAGEDLLDAVELEQDDLEPELVGLVDDDEQHLVVRRPAVQLALAPLAGQQALELQVLGVAERCVALRHPEPPLPVQRAFRAPGHAGTRDRRAPAARPAQGIIAQDAAGLVARRGALPRRRHLRRIGAGHRVLPISAGVRPPMRFPFGDRSERPRHAG